MSRYSKNSSISLPLMFASFSTYKRFLVIVLIMLSAVPCFTKREFKQWLNIETSQQTKPIQQQISCAVFYQLEEQAKDSKVEKHLFPSLIFDVKAAYFVSAKTIPFRDCYKKQKEKIPSYILFEQFII